MMPSFTAPSQLDLVTRRVLLFVPGMAAAIPKSDLKFPEPVYTALTIYLLAAMVRGALHEAVAGKSVVLLVGSMLVGWACGPRAVAETEGFFVEPFHGILALFLLERGLVAGHQLEDLRRHGHRLPIQHHTWHPALPRLRADHLRRLAA